MSTYRDIFDKFPDGITLHDAEDGSIIEVNQQFADMLGYTLDELTELGFEDIHVDEPPYTQERAEEYIRKAATEGPQTFEWMDRTKAGERLPVEVNLRLTTIGGERCVLAVVRDISERKQREKELERKNEKLDEFASIVSHDLQNPLSVIKGRVELAQEEHESEDLDAIERAVNRMEELIDDLSSLAREKDAPPDVEAVPLEDLAEECWKTVPTAEASLMVESDTSVRAEPRRLRQLLENLLRNAVEHGGERVSVRIGELEDADGFFIEDDGSGFPADRRDHLFEPGVSTKPEGTGYGLNIVRRVADAHGWEICVTDSRDGGARFEIRANDSGLS